MNNITMREVRYITVILTLGTMLAFSPDAFIPMLFRSFLWQIMGGGLLLALLFYMRKKVVLGSATASMSLLLLSVPPESEMLSTKVLVGPTLNVAHMNVLQPNTEHRKVIDLALASNADVIDFQEVSTIWANHLQEGLKERYPHQVVVPQNGCYGIALFSKLPLLDHEVLDLSGLPAIVVKICLVGNETRVITVHARSPIPASKFRKRNHQLAELELWLSKQQELPTVLMGDLNTVTWDDALINFRNRTGLSADGRGPMRTFPSVAGLGLIPIDHVLVSEQLGIGELTSFYIPGSDHRGLEARIGFK